MESESMRPDALAMFERFRAAPPMVLDKRWAESPLAGHNEAAWRAALPAALCWRFAPICEPR
jgi:hypothetical protein